ncbi:hypothetical protein [Paenibacillus sp. FSL R10-2734]
MELEELMRHKDKESGLMIKSSDNGIYRCFLSISEGLKRWEMGLGS